MPWALRLLLSRKLLVFPYLEGWYFFEEGIDRIDGYFNISEVYRLFLPFEFRKDWCQIGVAITNLVPKKTEHQKCCVFTAIFEF